MNPWELMFEHRWKKKKRKLFLHNAWNKILFYFFLFSSSLIFRYNEVETEKVPKIFPSKLQFLKRDWQRAWIIKESMNSLLLPWCCCLDYCLQHIVILSLLLLIISGIRLLADQGKARAALQIPLWFLKLLFLLSLSFTAPQRPKGLR